MHWIKTELRNSLYNLFGNQHPPTPILALAAEAQTSRIRWAMLGSLHGNARYPNVCHKVRFACDAHGLWYCRSELMAALADIYGETTARKMIHAITEMFQGLLPESLTQMTKHSYKLV